jgi:hypothetical protein
MKIRGDRRTGAILNQLRSYWVGFALLNRSSAGPRLNSLLRGCLKSRFSPWGRGSQRGLIPS